jgi:hypothetical protein
VAQLSTLGVIARMSKKFIITLAAVAIAVVVIDAGVRWYVRTYRTVDQAEDRRRWTQEIDAENAKSGFIKDTNGALIYVGTTNQVITK